MAITARKTPDAILFALASAYNAFATWVVAQLTTHPHADITSTPSGSYVAPTSTPYLVTVANATTLGTTIALANQAKAILNVHLADALANKAADSTDLITSDDATDQTTANTLLNEIKANYNTHIASATYHHTADTTNAVDAADATDAASSQTLATQIKAKLNAHVQAAPGSFLINLVAA